MREGALFGTMFGLGAGAVLVGVTVSRLVVGQASEKRAESPPALAAEASLPVLSSVAAERALSPAAGQPAEVVTQPQRRVLPRKHLRPPVVEPSLLEYPVEADGEPIAIVRGGPVQPAPGSRAPGPRVIQVDPQDGGS